MFTTTRTAEVGSLTDIAVHFTPEFFWRYIWEERKRRNGGSDFSFGLVPGAIELAILMLCMQDHIIIRAFHYGYDGRLQSNPCVSWAIDKVAYYRISLQICLKRMRRSYSGWETNSFLPVCVVCQGG